MHEVAEAVLVELALLAQEALAEQVVLVSQMA
jgi:hypothetical protein